MRSFFLSQATLCAVSLAASAFAQQPQLPPYKAGFPLTLPGEGSVGFSQPTLADLKIPGGRVGVKSIIFGNNQGDLHVIYQTAGGAWTEAPGFPVAVGGFIAATPAVGDLTGDGNPEIVVGYGNPATLGPGGVKAYRNSGGAALWSRLSNDRVVGGGPDPVLGSPAIGDVDNDGQNDVVWGSVDFRVYFVNGATGADKPNWPRDVIDSVRSSPVLHDMDGDGRLEIIMGVDAHADGTFGTPNGGCLHVMPATQPPIGASFPSSVGYPANLPGYPVCVDQVIDSSPAVGDIDGDGRPDIVHGTGIFYGSGAAPGFTPSERVYAWKCDGTSVSGWPVTISGQVNTSVALANLDADAALEVVVTADNTRSSTTFRLYAFNGNGSVLPGFPKSPKNFFGTTNSAANPIIADVLGADASSEILVPTNSEIAVFSAAGAQLTDDGTHVGQPSFYTPTSVAGVAVGDLDPGDAKIEVVVISASPFPTATDTVIHVWNPVSRATTPPWGIFRQNERHTGVAPGTGPCRVYGACPGPPAAARFFSITPCRIVDTRGGAPIGGPALASGGFRDFVLRGQCGIPTAAKAVSLNVTVVNPTNSGFVRFSPSCQPPTASTINFSPGQIRANNSVLQVGSTDGVLTANAFVTGGGTVHLLIDVNGYFQ